MRYILITLLTLSALGCNKKVIEKNCCSDPPFSYFLANVAFAIPNFFSPNGDGKNDSFGPLVNNNVLGYTFKIVDPKKTLWEGTGSTNTSMEAGYWDGRFEGQLQEGIFGWEIFVYTINEDTIDFRGQVCCLPDPDAYCIANASRCITAAQLDGIDFNLSFSNEEMLCNE